MEETQKKYVQAIIKASAVVERYFCLIFFICSCVRWCLPENPTKNRDDGEEEEEETFIHTSNSHH